MTEHTTPRYNYSNPFILGTTPGSGVTQRIKAVDRYNAEGRNLIHLQWDQVGGKVLAEGGWEIEKLARKFAELAGSTVVTAEARKVIGTALWGMKPDATDMAEKVAEALAAAGLLVGPGEPAASEGELVAWLDRSDRAWRMGDRLMMSTADFADTTRATVERLHGPLTPLYAHPSVTTAEPDTCDEHNDWFTCYEGSDGSWFISHYGTQYAPVTAEPATAPSVCGATVGPVPKLDGERFICALATGHDGDHEAIDGTWFVDSIARYPAPSVEQIANALNSRPYGFTDGQMAKRIRDLYAGAPETPGAGPSTSDIQQIENVLSRALCDDGVKREIAEAIHALYGTPGDAGEGETWTDADGVARDFVELQGAYGEEKAARLSAEAKVRGLKRRSDGAEEREEAQRIRANEEAQSVRGLRAEVERYKAALEAADELIEAEHAWGQSKLSAQIAIDERIRREHNVARTSAAYSAARAAVEAETSEEAGDE